MNQENSSTKAPSEPQKDSVMQFLESLRKLVPPQDQSASLRATPHGVFVERNFVPQFFGLYQKWFRDTLGREAPSSEQKCFKKFFNTPNPPLYYLVEAKVCLLGHLVRREYSDPQRLGLPTYLGTVDDTRTMLHPRDPMLVYMTNLQMKQGPSGREFILQAAKDTWSFSEKVLLEFSRLLVRSPQLSKQYPGQSSALRDTFKVLAGVLEKTRISSPKQRLLIPLDYWNRRDVSFSALGSLTFVIEGKQRVTACYEVGGRTLFRFVKREFAQMFSAQDRKRQGSVEILPVRSREIAALAAKGRRFFLHPRAFVEFLRATMRNPAENSSLPLKYTVRDALLDLHRSFQVAERIDRDKIARHLERLSAKNPQCWISSRWIFVTNRRDVIISCIDRFHTRPSPGQYPGRGRNGGGRRPPGRDQAKRPRA